MLEGVKVLWETKMPYDTLMLIKLSEGEEAFNTEMQNNPTDRKNALFPKEWTSYYNPFDVDFKDGSFEFYGYCDPSLGKSKNSDFSAIVTIAKDTLTGIVYGEDGSLERREPDKILIDILEKARRIERDYNKKYVSFGAETNQFQWFLKEQLAKESAKWGIYLPICEVLSHGDKTLRVQSLQPFIKNGYIKFSKEQKSLLNQLWDFPFGR